MLRRSRCVQIFLQKKCNVEFQIYTHTTTTTTHTQETHKSADQHVRTQVVLWITCHPNSPRTSNSNATWESVCVCVCVVCVCVLHIINRSDVNKITILYFNAFCVLDYKVNPCCIRVDALLLLYIIINLLFYYVLKLFLFCFFVCCCPCMAIHVNMCRILRSHTHWPSRRAEGILVRTRERPRPV